MPVFRVEKNKDYTTISNYHLRDKNLSLKSIGLLTIMLSLPDDWDYSLEGLTKITKDGLASVRTAIKELEDNKYLVRNQGRNKNGKFGDIEYLVYETPICEKSISVKPKAEKPISENRTQLNTNITKELNNKILNNNKKEIIKEKRYFEDDNLNDLFKDFLSMRKKIKAVNSDRAITLLINKLSKYDDKTKIKMIENSIENSWKGIYEPKEDNKQQFKHYKTQSEREKEVFENFLAKGND